MCHPAPYGRKLLATRTGTDVVAALVAANGDGKKRSEAEARSTAQAVRNKGAPTHVMSSVEVVETPLRRGEPGIETSEWPLRRPDGANGPGQGDASHHRLNWTARCGTRSP